MQIKLIETNNEKICNALEKVQAKCKERCLSPESVFALANFGEEQLDLHEVPKKYRKNATVESGRTGMSNSYGYGFTETMARVQRSENGSWYLVALERRKGWTQVDQKLTLPQLRISLEAELYLALRHPLISKETRAALKSLDLIKQISDNKEALTRT